MAGPLVYFKKTTLVDYPGKIAAALFFPLCNMRCPWCHNGALVTGEDNAPLLPLKDALAVIKKRKSLIEGVVLSGGEPSIFSGLKELCAYLKALGLCVKLDTNGACPQALRGILESKQPPDYVAMDIKTLPSLYKNLLGTGERNTEGGVLEEKIIESISLIREAFESRRIEAEFRSLVLPCGIFAEEYIKKLTPVTGSVPWTFRAFRPGSCLDPSWNNYGETPNSEVEHFNALLASSRPL